MTAEEIYDFIREHPIKKDRALFLIKDYARIACLEQKVICGNKYAYLKAENDYQAAMILYVLEMLDTKYPELC